MLYVFHGTDISQTLKKAHALIDSLRSKRPDAAFEHITGENWDDSIVESHLGGQGLFSSKYIIFLDRVTENAVAADKIEGFVKAMNESANIFIVLEGKLKADLKKVFEKNAEKIIEVGEMKSVAPKSEFNVFALADAVGSREAMKSWAIYRQAIENGLEAEGIIGTLFWQVKAMMLAATTKSATESGLSPFVYSKSKKFVSNYSQNEVKKMMTDLITLYHDGHRGAVDLEIGIEKFLLNLGKK